MIPTVILKDCETGGSRLESYEQDVTLTPAEEKFYLQMKELNEFQLFSNNGIPCVEEINAAYEAGLVGAALGGGFYHKIKLKGMKY